MQRRAFAKTALGALAGGALLKSPQSAHAAPCSDFPKVNGVTGETAKPKMNTFDVTGDFDAAELVQALNAAGFHVKVSK